ncbi:MAG: hypothetical protein JNL53_15530, partial [Cyclobacteriaceae bacterium]|nr:hypothetical protein [Cyclobacteriaceae bacterium]
GDRKAVELFQNEDTLWEFTKADNWHYALIIGKNYTVGDTEISSELIAPTIIKEFEKVVLVYRHMKDIDG